MGTLGRAIYTVGFWIRETGQAIDRLGCRLQGNYYFQEQLSRHRTLMNTFDKVPNVHRDAFVSPSASVIGDVQVGQGSSIWYGCVLRASVWCVPLRYQCYFAALYLPDVQYFQAENKSPSLLEKLVDFTNPFSF